jgi:hypothetical protein
LVPGRPYTTVAAVLPAGMPAAGTGPADAAPATSLLVLGGLMSLGLAASAVQRRQSGLRS